MKSVMLIDGKNLCYRMHWTHRGLSHDGFPTSILYGALTGLLSLARHLPDIPIVWLWDGDGKTWRHELAKDFYKSNRAPVVMPKDIITEQERMHKQLPILKQFLRKTGFVSWEVDNLECDDLVGIIVQEIKDRELFDNVIIHSGDKDFHQFIGDGVKQLKDIRDGRPRWADPDDIKQEFGVPVSKWTKLRAITGDPSDNIPKVFDGVGPATAAQFIRDGIDPSLENFDDHRKKVIRQFGHEFLIRKKPVNFRDSWDKVHLNYRLSRIVTDREDECLPETVRKDLSKICKNLKRTSFFRNPDKTDDKGWRVMTDFFIAYDLDSLMGRRRELWSLL